MAADIAAHECAAPKAGNVWDYEGIAFEGRLPDGASGAAVCPGESRPLYRLYNAGQGGAPDHRYTVDPSVVDTMLAQGWIFEGDATTRVFACVPLPG